MDKDFADIIQLMAREQGKEVLLNGKAKAFLSDYRRGQFPNEADIFLRILNANCGELINNADNVLERKQKLMVRLEDENGLSPKKTAEYLDLLGLILKGDTSKAETSTEVKSAKAKAAAEAKAEATAKAAKAKAAAEAKAAADARVAALRPVKRKLTLEGGSVYEGDIVNGKPHGKGKITTKNRQLQDETVYEGDFVDGKPHGKGIKTTFDLSLPFVARDVDKVYEGDFVDGKFTGKGKMKHHDDVFEGNFVDDKPYGKVKLTYKDGIVYEGNVVEKFHCSPSRTGKGKTIYPNGNVYEGDFEYNTSTGKGKQIWTSGSVWEENYKNGFNVQTKY